MQLRKPPPNLGTMNLNKWGGGGRGRFVAPKLSTLKIITIVKEIMKFSKICKCY